MITIKELIDKWNSISTITGGFLLVSEDHPLSFHIGSNGDSQKSFIVLDTGKIDKIASSKAIKVENIELENSSYALRFLLNYQSLDELFVKLCWDLMSASKDSQQPVKTLIDQYKKWLKLLHQVGNELLPTNSQKGLIGELMYLSDLIDAHGDSQALNEWVGPEGSDQDFIFENGWAEVKTTTIAGTSIQVSSLQQLDRIDDGLLIVYYLDKTTSFGKNTLSLNEAVSLILSKITCDPLIEQFEIKMAKCGFQNKDADKYSSYRFKYAEKRAYRVTNTFPRLTRKNIHSSIIEAQYSIDLPSIDCFKKRED